MIRKTLLLIVMFTLAQLVYGDDPADCTMCHDTSPVKASHPSVTTVSVDNCMMCHSSGATDALFKSLHETHPQLGMGCDSCHDSAGIVERSARLRESLPGSILD